MAIRHFGELLRDMSHYTWMLNDVVLGGLVPLILFLEDTDISVVKVSPVISFFLVLHRIIVFWATSDEQILSDLSLLHRHVDIH